MRIGYHIDETGKDISYWIIGKLKIINDLPDFRKLERKSLRTNKLAVRTLEFIGKDLTI